MKHLIHKCTHTHRGGGGVQLHSHSHAQTHPRPALLSIMHLSHHTCSSLLFTVSFCGFLPPSLGPPFLGAFILPPSSLPLLNFDITHLAADLQQWMLLLTLFRTSGRYEAIKYEELILYEHMHIIISASL